MKIIAIANQKGGCAKTTTVVNLACGLAEQGLKILVVDLDPQANATQWLGVPDDASGIYELLVENRSLKDLIYASSNPGVDVIAGSRKLSKVEQALAGQISIESILKRRMKRPELKPWDLILIDTPPTLGVLTLNALSIADEILVPVTTHVMSLIGVSQLQSTLQEVKEILNPELNILGYIPSRVDFRTRHAKDVVQSLKDRFGGKVFDSFIRENVSLAEAPSFKMGIMEYKSSSTAAEDYRALSKEIINRINLESK
jgi:chromosome partitioning protein